MKRFQSWLHNETGAVMVEFALISSVLILLLAGIIQFGLIFNAQLSLDNIAREGVRYASLPSNANDDAAAKTFILGLSNIPALTTGDITIAPSTREPGDAISLRIQYNYRIPVTFGVFPEELQLTATSVMMQN